MWNDGNNNILWWSFNYACWSRKLIEREGRRFGQQRGTVKRLNKFDHWESLINKANSMTAAAANFMNEWMKIAKLINWLYSNSLISLSPHACPRCYPHQQGWDLLPHHPKTRQIYQYLFVIERNKLLKTYILELYDL